MLDQFGFRYVDDDQSIMWYGAVEMSRDFSRAVHFPANLNEGLVIECRQLLT